MPLVVVFVCALFVCMQACSICVCMCVVAGICVCACVVCIVRMRI